MALFLVHGAERKQLLFTISVHNLMFNDNNVTMLHSQAWTSLFLSAQFFGSVTQKSRRAKPKFMPDRETTYNHVHNILRFSDV